MNDIKIIKTISNIYFVITSFLLFIFLTLCVVFVILQNGFYIDSISLPNIKIKQLYIKWDEKLNISIKESKIILKNDKSDSKISTKKIYQAINKVPQFTNIFESIYIDKITINETVSSIKYSQSENGYITTNSPDISFKSNIFFESKLLNIDIEKLYDKKRDIKIDGNIIIDAKANTTVASININIHNEVDLKLYTHANEKGLLYRVDSLKDIKSIKYTMELLNLYKGVRYWAYEAIGLSSLSINNIYGWIDFNDLKNAYKNLYASAIGHNLTYRYNKKLDVIHTKETRVEFKNGILYIRPQQHYTYNSKLGKSWLKIDFTKKEELLTLYLLFDGKLDKDTLGVLKAYKIDVPFLQNSGITKTNLTIKVYLRTIDIDAKGVFFTKKANFKYQGFDIDIFNTKIELNNYDIRIKNMLAKYEDIITATVDTKYNARDGAGAIDFNIEKIDFKKTKVSLAINDTPLKVRYNISKKQDKIFIDNSLWKIDNSYANMDKITLPFNLETAKVVIPNTKIAIGEFLKANLSGSADFKKIKFDLDLWLEKLLLDDIKLTEKILLKLKYDKKLTLNSDKKVNLELNSKKLFLDNLNVDVSNNIINIKDLNINFNDFIKTDLSLNYSLDEKNGYIKIDNLLINDEKLGLIYSKNTPDKFNINIKNDIISIDSKELSLLSYMDDNGWGIEIDSLAALSKNSKLLKKYFIKDGSISIKKLNNENQINLNGSIIYPHRILVLDDNEIENYFINGNIYLKDNTAYLTINDIINIDINKDNKINISAQKIGINTNAIVDVLNSFESDSKSSNKLDISIETKDSYLYISKDRHIISQSMNLEYQNNILNAQLKHYDGVAKFLYEKKHFYVHGDNFNDRFMENLFALSDFKNGKFEFDISGTAKKYDGIFTVKNTTILDYKILNNILAFVNTVPSLLTFSIPGYNKKGLKVKTAYMKFKSDNDILDISDIYLDSKEIDILGKGKASIINDTIDLELNLRSDLGSKISKIPLVGYLILDKDSISTTLSITGKLSNPDIKSLVAKDIAVAPLNILKRTLTLPYELIKGKSNTNKKD